MQEKGTDIKISSRNFFSGTKSILLYAFSLALLLFLLNWLQSRFLVIHGSFELYAGAIAIVFTALGVWLAKHLIEPKTEQIIIEKEVLVPAPAEFVSDKKAITSTNLSPRELEVLELMAKGLSNVEIAEQLFVSLNTVKTHSSNLFVKLDVKRRTQAAEKAKRLKIIE